MKHLENNNLFLELDSIRKEELNHICYLALEYCKEHDLRSSIKTIDEYVKMFKGNYKEIKRDD